MKNISLVTWIGFLSIVKLAAAAPPMGPYFAWSVSDFVPNAPQPLITLGDDPRFLGLMFKNAEGRIVVGLDHDLPPEKARCYFAPYRRRGGEACFNAPFALGGGRGEKFVIVPQLAENDELHLLGSQGLDEEPPCKYRDLEKQAKAGSFWTGPEEAPRWASDQEREEFAEKLEIVKSNYQLINGKLIPIKPSTIEGPSSRNTPRSDRQGETYNEEELAELNRLVNTSSKGGFIRRVKKFLSLKRF